MKIRLDDRKIRMIMYDNGMTQVELSKRSGVSRPTLSKAVSGGTCSAETGKKICTALGIDIKDVATFNRF